MRTADKARRAIASAALIAAAAGPITLAVSPANAADDCQHFTHRHYHFPYAHYDTHEYHGSHWHWDQRHYHHYYNATHTTPYEKRC